MADSDNRKIVYFDGVCNLCESSVQFIIKRNTTKNLFFASLQSQTGQEMLKKFNLPIANFGSFVFLENGKIYTQSTGALRVTKYLNGAWPTLYSFLIVPPFIRNAVYNFISKNRYKWFGSKTECWLPTPDLKSRFLE